MTHPILKLPSEVLQLVFEHAIESSELSLLEAPLHPPVLAAPVRPQYLEGLRLLLVLRRVSKDFVTVASRLRIWYPVADAATLPDLLRVAEYIGPSVRGLSLSGMATLDEGCWSRLAQAFPMLDGLHFASVQYPTYSELCMVVEAFQRRLKTLDCTAQLFSRTGNATWTVLELLQRLSCLQQLHLQQRLFAQFGDLSLLLRLPHLRSLWIHSLPQLPIYATLASSAAFFDPLRHLQHLTQLTVVVNMTDAVLLELCNSLACLPRLRSLTLNASFGVAGPVVAPPELTPQILQALAPLATTLRRLRLPRPLLENQVAQLVEALPELQDPPPIPVQPDLRILASLLNLTRLELVPGSPPGWGRSYSSPQPYHPVISLAQTGSLRRVVRLHLTSVALSNDAIRAMGACMRALRSFDYSAAQGVGHVAPGELDLTALGQCAALEIMQLQGLSISLPSIAPLTSLVCLALRMIPATESTSVVNWLPLRRLKHLVLALEGRPRQFEPVYEDWHDPELRPQPSPPPARAAPPPPCELTLPDSLEQLYLDKPAFERESCVVRLPNISTLTRLETLVLELVEAPLPRMQLPTSLRAVALTFSFPSAEEPMHTLLPASMKSLRSLSIQGDQLALERPGLVRLCQRLPRLRALHFPLSGAGQNLPVDDLTALLRELRTLRVIEDDRYPNSMRGVRHYGAQPFDLSFESRHRGKQKGPVAPFGGMPN